MTMTETNPASRNGVDTATLFATLDAVKQMPAAAQFQFRAHNEWVNGTHNRSTISDFFGVGDERDARANLRVRRRSPGGARRPGQRADACRIRAARAGRRA